MAGVVGRSLSEGLLCAKAPLQGLESSADDESVPGHAAWVERVEWRVKRVVLVTFFGLWLVLLKTWLWNSTDPAIQEPLLGGGAVKKGEQLGNSTDDLQRYVLPHGEVKIDEALWQEDKEDDETDDDGEDGEEWSAEELHEESSLLHSSLSDFLKVKSEDNKCHPFKGAYRYMLDTTNTTVYHSEGGSGHSVVAHHDSCLGPPYLYMSYHGGKRSRTVHNLCRYTRDGCSAGAVLLKSHRDGYKAKLLRGVLPLDDGKLIVGESWRKDSRILRYSECRPELGNRRFLEATLVSNNVKGQNPHAQSPGLVHPYGFSKAPNDNFLFVSTQGTSEILRYDINSGKASPRPSHFEGDEKSGDPAAFFVSMGRPGVRGITTDGQRLYMADKWRGVVVLDAATGEQLKLWHLPKPIALWYSVARNSLFVGSSRTHAVYELDLNDEGKVVRELTHHSLRHPAGIVGYYDDLFVVSQRKAKLLKFSISTGKMVQEVLEHLPDDGERVALVDC